MSERKVLNKYFPPDFDPAKIPRRKMPKDEQHKVRLMTPFSMRCKSCGDYVYKGKKFNARKERVQGELYLGIQIFRFYIRCPRCSAEITFKTDPKNSDYVAEHGAERNFEPWREETDVNARKDLERSQEEENNPMKALENRTMDSKREMDILDALDEIRTKNAQNERVNADKVLDKLLSSKKNLAEWVARRQEEEDDAIAKAMFNTADGSKIKRILDDDDDNDDDDTNNSNDNVQHDDTHIDYTQSAIKSKSISKSIFHPSSHPTSSIEPPSFFTAFAQHPSSSNQSTHSTSNINGNISNNNQSLSPSISAHPTSKRGSSQILGIIPKKAKTASSSDTSATSVSGPPSSSNAITNPPSSTVSNPVPTVPKSSVGLLGLSEYGSDSD